MLESLAIPVQFKFGIYMTTGAVYECAFHRIAFDPKYGNTALRY